MEQRVAQAIGGAAALIGVVLAIEYFQRNPRVREQLAGAFGSATSPAPPAGEQLADEQLRDVDPINGWHKT